MDVVLSFDIEVWCGSWDELDARFPAAYERYVYGRSRHGDYALPKTLEILSRHGLRGVFFVEPLFAARFGIKYLTQIVRLILDAGQDVQLHLHPEWTDEITPPPIAEASIKRQHMSHYAQDEQRALIAFGIDLLQKAGASRPSAFRAGSFAANSDTFHALVANDIMIDFSLNATLPICAPDLRTTVNLHTPQSLKGVFTYPMSVFRDGNGRERHLQFGACSAPEFVESIESAYSLGWPSFVCLSHNFEMMKLCSTEVDWLVVRRFEKFCAYLATNRERFRTTHVRDLPLVPVASSLPLPHVSRFATLRRIAEQGIRRMVQKT